MHTGRKWMMARWLFSLWITTLQPGWSAEKAVPLESLYDEGFWFSGPDDKLRIGGWAQTDARLLEGGHPGANTFTTRRARLLGTGYLEKHFGYLVMIALERPSSPLQFAWLEYTHHPALKIRVGQFKEPYSMEELTADLYLDLLERSIGTSNFSPAQDLGAMIHGKLLKNRLEYAMGVFNGRGKNTEDNTDSKDFAGRLTVAPLAGLAQKWTKTVILGVNGTLGKQNEDFSSKSLTTAAQTKFWTYANGVSLTDDRARLGVDMEWLVGPASLKSEWARTTFGKIRKGTLTADAIFSSWYVSTSYLLTGEDKPRSKPVKPKRGLGAWELALRYEEFLAEQSMIQQGFATGSHEVRAITSGINWTPNHHIRLSFNHVYSSFDDSVTVSGKAITKENLYLLRTQFEF